MVGVNMNSASDGTHVTGVSSDSSALVCATDSDPQLISRQQIDLTGYDSCVSNNVPPYINDLMYKGYGAFLIHSDGAVDLPSGASII